MLQSLWISLAPAVTKRCACSRLSPGQREQQRTTDGKRCNVVWQVAWLIRRGPDQSEIWWQDLTFLHLLFYCLTFFAIFMSGWGGTNISWPRLNGLAACRTGSCVVVLLSVVKTCIRFFFHCATSRLCSMIWGHLTADCHQIYQAERAGTLVSTVIYMWYSNKKLWDKQVVSIFDYANFFKMKIFC